VFTSINKSQIQNISIPVPPIAEQKRIVEILDKAFEGIAKAEANTKQNLANARQLFDSYLNKIFRERGDEWIDKNLADIAIEFGRGKSKHRPRNDKKLYGGKYPFVQTGDIRNSDHILTNYSQTYNNTGLAQSKLWKKGTVCITIAANIAETAVLDFDACIPDSVIGL
jgi:type I restriction enzyme, S subunit